MRCFSVLSSTRACSSSDTGTRQTSWDPKHACVRGFSVPSSIRACSSSDTDTRQHALGPKARLRARFLGAQQHSGVLELRRWHKTARVGTQSTPACAVSRCSAALARARAQTLAQDSTRGDLEARLRALFLVKQQRWNAQGLHAVHGLHVFKALPQAHAAVYAF